MSIFFEILVRIASYGPQIDQSHGENRLRHIIMLFIPLNGFLLVQFFQHVPPDSGNQFGCTDLTTKG